MAYTDTQFVWDEQCNVGVDVIDEAHQNLFAIVRRILRLSEDGRGGFASQEGIHYFKNYALKHFAEEEKYMRSINYPGYEAHRQLHTNLRDVTLPALEKELNRSSCSDEAVQHFLGICVGWLIGHIMLEDRAITGKVESKWVHQVDQVEVTTLADVLTEVIHDLFGWNVRVVSDHYGGEPIGETVDFVISYPQQARGNTQVIVAMEKSLALEAAGHMLSLQLEEVNTMVVETLKQVAGQIVQRLWTMVQGEDAVPQHTVEEVPGGLSLAFQDRFPPFSLLLDTRKGYMAVCIQADALFSAGEEQP